MRSLGKFLIFFAILCIIGCAVFGYQAYDKYFNYFNNSYRSQNAYVGGDAYNYIINGTYFTGFSVLCASCGLGALLCLIAGIYLQEKAAQEENQAKYYYEIKDKIISINNKKLLDLTEDQIQHSIINAAFEIEDRKLAKQNQIEEA